jgi:hypothetical protein
MRRAVIAAAIVAAGLLVVSALLAAQATARAQQLDGRQVGEVIVNGTVVIRLRTDEDGQSPVERARQVADRLNDAFKRRVGPGDFSVVDFNGKTAVKAKDSVIVTTTNEEAKAAQVDSAAQLARQWHANIVRALGGDADGDADWDIAAKKYVPVLSVDRHGARVGAAQVGGPKEQVDKVKAVALLEADYHRKVRAKIYIPVSSVNLTKLSRVQGVSVVALVDVKVLGF